MDIQLNPTADIENSTPICFKARLIEDPINGFKKWELMVTMSKKFSDNLLEEGFCGVIIEPFLLLMKA